MDNHHFWVRQLQRISEDRCSNRTSLLVLSPCQLLKSQSNAELGQAASSLCGGSTLQKDPSSRVGTLSLQKCSKMPINVVTVWQILCRDYTCCSETCQVPSTWSPGGSCFCRTKVKHWLSLYLPTPKDVYCKSNKSVFPFNRHET